MKAPVIRASHHGSWRISRDPFAGDVPVVVDVVVVEDHRRGHGREQPADIRVGPRLAVETRVLLEVRNLLARRLPHVAPGLDELRRSGRHLVGVDLVAEQEQRIGPLDVAELQLSRVRPERIDAGLGELSSLRLRIASSAGAEDESHLSLAATRVHHWSRPAVVGRPDHPPVKANVVVDQRGRLEIIDQEQRVVMLLDTERPVAVAEDLNLAGPVRLEPKARALRARVAQHRAQHQLRCRRPASGIENALGGSRLVFEIHPACRLSPPR